MLDIVIFLVADEVFLQDLHSPRESVPSAHRETIVSGRVELSESAIKAVVIAGGAGHAEIFDPASLRFSLIVGPEMEGRYFSTATLLGSGRVLLVGGYGENAEPSSNGAWIYMPSVKSVGPKDRALLKN